MRNIIVENPILSKVSIVMPVLGNCNYTKNFFDSFYGKTKCDYEFIIINNGDDLETENYLKEIMNKDNKVRVIKNEKNLGVSASWNQGIKESSCDYICIINNDIEIMTPEWLCKLQLKLMEDENIYWTSPHTCYTKDMKKRIYRIHHYEQLLYGVSKESYVVGCCFMCPKRAFNDIGLFDEQFNIKYYEDLDFINRILESRHRVAITNEVLVYHAVGATSRITKGGEENAKAYEEKWGNSKYDILKKQPPKENAIKRF